MNKPNIQTEVEKATPENQIDVAHIRNLVEQLAASEGKKNETREVVLNGRTGAYEVRHNGEVKKGFKIDFANEDQGLKELIRALKWAGVRDDKKIAKEAQRYLTMSARIRQATEEAQRAIVRNFTAGLPV